MKAFKTAGREENFSCEVFESLVFLPPYNPYARNVLSLRVNEFALEGHDHEARVHVPDDASKHHHSSSHVCVRIVVAVPSCLEVTSSCGNEHHPQTTRKTVQGTFCY